MSKEIQWNQWGWKYRTKLDHKGRRVKEAYRSMIQEGTRADLIGSMKLQIMDLPLHVWMYNWQADQMLECKKNLCFGEILMIVDFAKNLTLPRQFEVQHGFFYRKAVTLHPVVMHYHQFAHCKVLTSDEFMCVSKDLTHDAHAVFTYVKAAMAHLRGQGTPVEKLYIFSDNCSVQYKSKLPFELLQHYGVPAEHHYQGAGHGKGEADASIGRLKQRIERVIKEGSAKIQNALELYLWLQRNNTPDVFITPGTQDCVHYQREFHYVNSVDRSYVGSAKTIKGTMQIHSVKTTGILGQLKCRDTSCFCRCF
jgi:hypothetical protein